MATDTFIPTRESLLARLKDWDDQASWQEFVRTYGRLVRAAAFKAGLTETEADEVVQETFLAVARNIGEFRYDPAKCSFKGWLLLITRQRIIWQWRQRQKVGAQASDCPPGLESTRQHGFDGGDDPRTATIDRVPDEAGLDLDAHWESEWEKNLLAVAVERVKRQVKSKQFQMFDLYAQQNWPAGEVARTLRVGVAQVYLAKHRVGRLLKREVARLEKEPR